MINTQKIIKVAMAWTSIVYVVCFAFVGMMPGIRPGFMMYGLHTNAYSMMRQYGFQDILTFTTLISGLVIWNVIAVLGVWLFASLWNRIK